MAKWTWRPVLVIASCFFAMAGLVWISASSPPKSHGLAFLTTTIQVTSGTSVQMRKVSFGVFGFTGSNTSFGYYMPSYFPTLDFDAKRQKYHTLTYFLALYPLSAGLFGLALIFGLLRRNRVMSLFAALGCLCGLTAWIISDIFFGMIGHSLSLSGITSEVGYASRLGIALIFLLSISFITSSSKYWLRPRTSCRRAYNTADREEENAGMVENVERIAGVVDDENPGAVDDQVNQKSDGGRYESRGPHLGSKNAPLATLL